MNTQTLVLIAVAVGALVYYFLYMRNKQDAWLETRFGNSEDKVGTVTYPPCYRICGASQRLYDIAASNGLLEKYKTFLEMQSILLCQEIYLQTKSCDQTMFTKRHDYIKVFPFTEKGHAITRKYAPNAQPLTKRFLTHIASAMEEEKQKLKRDVRPGDVDNVENLTNTFYAIHFPVIEKGDCN
jgi:hypothetical protein